MSLSDSLVSTKLRPSGARPKLVARPRLTEKLKPEAGRRLTLVSAPAGFGKTTLLSEWLESYAKGERPVAWLSLDEGDNDPARFLSYLVAALGTVEQGIGEGVLSSLRSPEPPRIEAVTGALVNELSSVSHEEWAMVLDDYHVIEAEPIHGMVTFFLDRLPEGAHLIIASRVDPPLPLSRLRVRGQIAELRSAELRFTLEDAAAFLGDVMGLELSEEDVAALEERTEGWIAGLQLAALSMRDRKDIPGFVRAFSGGHRDVLDFLAEEVLERQPEPVRGFLLRTSILDRLSGPLCDALTGASDGQTMLERLDSENLFLIPLDDERHWYRYHHLFADFLRGRLRRESPHRLAELHRRASDWYERSGWLFEAVGHALAAEDHERAAVLVERVARETWSRGEVLTLLGWLRKLPEEAVRRRPKLFLDHATALVVAGQTDDIEPLLREAERAAGEATAGEARRRYLLGYAAAVRSWGARLRGDAHDAVDLARRALSLLPEDDPGLRSFAAICLGEALWTTGDLAEAGEAFAEAAELGRISGHVLGILMGMANHALVQVQRGRLREAANITREALRLATERGVEPLPAAGSIHIGMGELHYEWNELECAERELTKGVELAERTGEIGSLVRGHIYLSRVKRALGNEEEALEMARKADRLARSSGASHAISEVAAWMAWMRMAGGDPAEAAASEQERAVKNVDAAYGAARMVERITQARLLRARGKHDEALRLLEELYEEAEAAGRTGGAIEILAHHALSLWGKGDKERAVNALGGALALAEPEGYVRTFVDEGPPMAELLSGVLETQQRRHLTAGVPVHYLRKLLAALEQDASSTASRSTGLPEPLSERELEVLALVGAGKSNRRIARELFVADSTVKTHVNNVYRKLEVRSRTQALARARELGLL